MRRLYPEALASYEKALALDPAYGAVLNEVAYIYIKTGEPAKGVPYLERYAAVNPGDPNPLDSLAELLMRTGKLDDSVAKYKEVLAAHPDFYLSWSSLAYVDALQENYPEAMRCLDEHAARAPAGTARMSGIWLRAYYRYLLGQWDAALKEFQELRAQAERVGIEYLTLVTDWIMVYIQVDRREFDDARRKTEAWAALYLKRNPSRRDLIGAQVATVGAWVDVGQGRLLLPAASPPTSGTAEDRAPQYVAQPRRFTSEELDGL